MNMTHILAAGILIVLSGCAGVGAESTLEYDGSENGTHSDAIKCDDQGSIKGSGNIPDGTVAVTLTDAEGKVLLQQTFQGDFTLEEKDVSGASGSWSFRALRSGDDVVGDSFSGDYEFHVNC